MYRVAAQSRAHGLPFRVSWVRACRLLLLVL